VGLFFNATCSIWRPGASASGPEPDGDLVLVAEGVSCRKWKDTNRGKETGEAFDRGVDEWRIALPVCTDVHRIDTIEIDGVRYEVESVDRDPAGRGHHMELDCKVVG